MIHSVAVGIPRRDNIASDVYANRWDQIPYEGESPVGRSEMMSTGPSVGVYERDFRWSARMVSRPFGGKGPFAWNEHGAPWSGSVGLCTDVEAFDAFRSSQLRRPVPFT